MKVLLFLALLALIFWLLRRSFRPPPGDDRGGGGGEDVPGPAGPARSLGHTPDERPADDAPRPRQKEDAGSP